MARQYGRGHYKLEEKWVFGIPATVEKMLYNQRLHGFKKFDTPSVVGEEVASIIKKLGA